MDNYFQRDSRIEDNTALRDLEKKVHYILHMLSDAGMCNDENGYSITIPDDMNGQDLTDDATSVKRSKKSF